MFEIVINPVAGHGRAKQFVSEHVTPLLDKLGQPYRIWTTTAPKHAGDIAREILKARSETRDHASVKVIVAGGDGTAHELIEGAMAEVDPGSPEVKWELIILPLGTANALHASLFSSGPRPEPSGLAEMVSADADARRSISSLLAGLSPDSSLRRLPITTTTLLDSNNQHTSERIHSHIVTSTSLHAALLQTSEELRAEHPGLERFKMAAERNLGVFFQARLRLLPSASSPIQQYDPKTRSFVAPYTTDGHDCLEGPFTYLLSTTVCERLEPTFVINPTIRAMPPNPQDATMDIVVLRPLRDPDVARASGEVQPEAWKKRAMEVIGNAYKDGKHVDLTYQADGGPTVLQGEGPVAVETFRVGGFEWTPTDQDHAPSHLVCADGAIHEIPTGGIARVQVDTQTQTSTSFWVYA